MTIGALTRQAAERLVEAATAAPSMYNAQPWRFVARLADRVIEIYADPARTLRRGDPRGRAVHIACGAALFNLRLAVAHAGAEPVARLLPNPRDPLLLASVRIAGQYRPRPAERDLHAAITYHAGTRRGTAGQTPLRAVLAALTEAAALEGASLRVLEQPDALRILQSVAAADRALRPAPGYLTELREFPSRPLDRVAAGNGTGKLAVIATTSDDRPSWLRAGQAMQRVLLLAAHRGLSAVPLTPVLELPDVPLRPDPRFGAAHPEMIVRLGGPADNAPPLFRRPVGQVMRVLARQDEGPRAMPPPALSGAQAQLMRSR